MTNKSSGEQPAPQSSMDPPEVLTFEQALERLEKIVGQLEDGQLGLNESLTRYEEGVKYLKQCYEQLERAEQRIELLARIDAKGQVQARPFSDDAQSLEQKQAARSRRRSQRPPDSSPRRPDAMDDPTTLF
jgi:exodeoxyribonuclease VII small subunit